ncbi:hypothetical protein C1646_745481 [Rhizophagus diaphanus]|nr:hypothetical protein C1646_745481 [Rhizophagus diaphanus] [Rhizophagus sp. MUCL 43196]
MTLVIDSEEYVNPRKSVRKVLSVIVGLLKDRAMCVDEEPEKEEGYCFSGFAWIEFLLGLLCKGRNFGFDFADFFNDSGVDFGIAIVCPIDDFLPKKNHMEITGYFRRTFSQRQNKETVKAIKGIFSR